MKKKYIISLVFFCGIVFGLHYKTLAQQLDQIGKEQGVSVTGGFGLNQSLYYANGVDNRYYPYSAMASGNLNFNLYGISVPISFAYSNQKLSYSQPFNIVGLSPTYKNFTVHAGYRNLSFSKYTLAGHNFLGGGAEYKGSKWNVAVMGGRLLKGVEYDSTSSSRLPVYMRVGYGFKVGYANNGEEINLTTFYAKDDESSINEVPITTGVSPMENMVYSLQFKKKLTDKITLDVEGARSATTNNTRDTTFLNNANGFDKTVFFIPVTSNTIYSYAINAQLGIQTGKTNWGFGLERVDGDFKTLGAYYLNNDFQNITINASRAFIKNKLNVSARFGIQQDDLKNEKQSNTERLVGSLNVSAAITERLNLNFSYSAFNTYINVKPFDRTITQNSEYERIDTLDFQQFNQTLTAGLNYVLLDNDNVMHSLNLGSNYNLSANKQSSSTDNTSIFGTNGGYNIQFKKLKYNIGVNINYNRNDMSLGSSEYIGGGLNNSIMALKSKLRISLGGNYNNNYESGKLTAVLFSINNSYNYRLGEHHSINLNVRYNRRVSKAVASLSYYSTTFEEVMATLGYNYNF